MDKIKFTELNLDLRFYIRALYGVNDYTKIKKGVSITSLKNAYLKITKSIRHAINETIVSTDSHHKKGLLADLDTYEIKIKQSKSFNHVNQYMIIILSKTVFGVLGGTADSSRSGIKFTNKQRYWRLNFCRQIIYLQSIEQKKNLLFEVIQTKYLTRFGSVNDFICKIYIEQCKNDPEIFLNWIKKNHSDIYLETF